MGIFGFWKNKVERSGAVIIKESAQVRMKTDISGEVLNAQNGFYNCCGGYRYVGKGEPPFEINCPDCGEIVANYSILHRSSIEETRRSNPDFLMTVFEKTKHYHPILCDLIRSTLKSGKYAQTIELGWKVHERGQADGFKGTMPLDLICEAILEWESQEKRRGNSEKAVSLRLEYNRVQKDFLGNDIVKKTSDLISNLDNPISENVDGYFIFEFVEGQLRAIKKEVLDGDRCRQLFRLLEKALTASVSSNTQAKILRRMGEIKSMLGDVEKELDYLRQAVQINPKIGVKSRIEKLENGLR